MKVIQLFRNKGAPLGRKKWPDILKHEIAILTDDRAITRDVRVNRLPNGGLVILCTLRTDLTAEPPKADIRDEEAIALVYSHGLVGAEAPGVYSDRFDFPRSLPHLNPVSRTSPVSICLAREGLQRHYERYGIRGVVDRLRRWLRDAKAGSLSRDGWEPVPISNAALGGIIDGAEFQDFALQHGDHADWAGGIATIGTGVVFLQAADLRAAQHPFDPNRDAAAPADPKTGTLRRVPLIFAWHRNTTPGTDFVFGECTDAHTWWGDVNSLSLDTPIREAIERVPDCDISVATRDVKVVAVLGVRRPLPIIGDRFGLSLNAHARSIELRAYLLTASALTDFGHNGFAVSEIALSAWPNQGLIADVSGFDAPPASACIVGYGALGSEIGAFLGRMGVPRVSVIDPDRLQAHNLARHVGTVFEVGEFKSSIHTRQELHVSLDAKRGYRGYPKRLDEISAEEFATCTEEARLVIDATADERVRRNIIHRIHDVPIVRIELFDDGYLGVASVQGSDGNPDLIDLYHWLCQQGVNEPCIQEWLDRESRDTDDGSIVVAGFSCASASVRLPKWVVSSHAAAFMSIITSALCGNDIQAGIGLNPLNRDRLPIGWKWLGVAPFVVAEKRVKGIPWQVRTAPTVFERIRDLAYRSAPSETGGYLYGAFDLHLRRITVTAATPEPPGSKSGRLFLELAPAGRTPEELAISTCCGPRIAIVGTWHSHPGGSAEMSGRDRRTAQGLFDHNRTIGLPTLVVICGEKDFGVHLLC